jgi:hypothetical protein
MPALNPHNPQTCNAFHFAISVKNRTSGGQGQDHGRAYLTG